MIEREREREKSGNVLRGRKSMIDKESRGNGLKGRKSKIDRKREREREREEWKCVER